MKKREFLTDVNIVAATLVSRCGKILHHTIPNLLKWSDWVLLMQDNINEETRNIILDYKKKYPDRIQLAETGFPPATVEQENAPRGLFHRFKPLQGQCRQKVFDYIKDKNVDILIFSDSDEIWSNSFPELLKEFWSKPDIMGATCKPVDVFGDMSTIHDRSMTGHTRLLKPFDGLSALPYRTACYYNGLTKTNRIGNSRTLIHLCSLTQEKRDWRDKSWKPNHKKSQPLWSLPKPVYEMTPEELRDILHKEPDMNIEEYLRGGEKRKPVGVNNATQAMEDASNLLAKLDVTHFMAFGTCLGMVRDGKILKYDWDVDFICLGEDIEKINNNKDKILEAGFTDFKCKKDIPKWRKEDGTMSEEKYTRTYSFKKYGVRIDIDPAYLSKDEKSRIILKGRKRRIFCAKHPAKWFDNHQKERHYPMPVPVEDYLESNYGKNWRTPKYGPVSWDKRACMSQTYDCK